MSDSRIECSQCGSHEYELVDNKSGEVRCPYCRSAWTVPSLVQKTETEKFLEQQREQPRVVIDNTTETDKKLMDMFSSILNPDGCLKRVSSLVAGVIVVIILIIAAIVLFNVLR